MRVAEIFQSAQGEGLLTGTESVFVRASGCNLRCWFCDTPYTSWNPEGDDLGVDDIVDRVSSFSCSHVVLTGGEPMLFAELVPLSARLKALGLHITIETAGTLMLPVACDLMSISPKLSNSAPDRQTTGNWYIRHERTRDAPTVIRDLVEKYEYQFKFVVESPEDCEEVENYLDDRPFVSRNRAMLMPQAVTSEELLQSETWLKPWCVQHGLNYCPRKHIEQFGLARGT